MPTPATSTLASTTMATIPQQPKSVITAHPVLGMVPPAGTNLQFQLQLPSKIATLPNHIHICKTDPPHLITLAMPGYPPCIDQNVESFWPHTLHKMVLINFFSRIGVRITMAIHIQATNASLVINQYFCNHYRMDYCEPWLPISPDMATLILPWVRGIWAVELGVGDAVQTAPFTLFLYETPGLDNPSCLIQAYNTPVGLIDSWMVYPQYTPFPQPPETAKIHCIYLQCHSKTDHPIPLLQRHDLSVCWNLLPPGPLPQRGLPSDHPSMVLLRIPQPGTNLLLPI
uniref:Uncharacterized protein n=1 Tax=Romanomermis culicivorax TaxID=13658 RepID=A0A915IES1_ROMCU